MKSVVTKIALGLCSLCSAQSLAQIAPHDTKTPAGAGTAAFTTVKGQVADAVTKRPVEFASVVLLHSTEQVAVVDCGPDGTFILPNVPPGQYQLLIRLVGYIESTDTVDVPVGGLHLGTRLLTQQAQQLQGVTVTGVREMVENRPDGLVYNAELDITNAGGTAADVLRKAPLINLDPQGNVSLRGTGNVRILINNRTSSIFANNLAEALQQLPADQIKSIEILTSPSAKYDAEGAGGVINIVLKNNRVQGYNGTIGSTAGNRTRNLNGSLNASNLFWGVNSSLSLFSNHYPYRNSALRVDMTPAAAGKLAQRMESDSRGRGYYGQLGISFDPTAEHSFSLTTNLNGSLLRSPQEQYTVYDRLSTAFLDSVYARSVAQRNGVFNYDVNGAYTRTYANQSMRKWEVLAQYSRSNTVSRYQLDQFAGWELFQVSPEYRERSANKAGLAETTLQTDYTHPFTQDRTLSIGAKFIGRDIQNEFTIDSVLTARQPDFARSLIRSNRFTYSQNVLAAYAIYKFALGKKTSAEVGVRTEYTAIGGHTHAETDFRNSYYNLLPNVSLSRNLTKPGHSVRINFNQRIQRPQLGFLSPYVDQSDPQNVWYGNPTLTPELTTNYEATYSAFGPKGALNISAYNRRTSRSIELVSFYNEQLRRTESTFQNISNNSSTGVNLYGNLRLKPMWQIGANVNVAYTRLRSSALDYTASRITYTANFNGSYRFAKDISIQFYGGYNSPGIQLQSRYTHWLYYTTGIKKALFSSKVDLVLTAANFLTNTRRFRYITTTDQFINTLTSDNYLRSISLSLTYRFGKSGGLTREENRAVDNSDKKDGGGKQTQRGPQ